MSAKWLFLFSLSVRGFLCLFQREINIFVQKEKKDPHRFRTDFTRTGVLRSGTVSDGKRKPENEVLEWQVAGFGSLIRLTGIYFDDQNTILSDTCIVICIKNEPDLE